MYLKHTRMRHKIQNIPYRSECCSSLVAHSQPRSVYLRQQGVECSSDCPSPVLSIIHELYTTQPRSLQHWVRHG